MGQYGNLKRVSANSYSKMVKDPDAFYELEDQVITLDLGKAWHAMHYLLTGTAWDGEPPLNFICAGEGTPLGVSEDERDSCEDDQDWQEIIGAAPTGFSPKQMQEIHAALSQLDEATIQSRMDPDKLDRESIYPSVWYRPEEKETNRIWLGETFEALKEFIAEAAANGDALIVELDLG
jgi:hypothetical protein